MQRTRERRLGRSNTRRGITTRLKADSASGDDAETNDAVVDTKTAQLVPVEAAPPPAEQSTPEYKYKLKEKIQEEVRHALMTIIVCVLLVDC